MPRSEKPQDEHHVTFGVRWTAGGLKAFVLAVAAALGVGTLAWDHIKTVLAALPVIAFFILASPSGAFAPPEVPHAIFPVYAQAGPIPPVRVSLPVDPDSGHPGRATWGGGSMPPPPFSLTYRVDANGHQARYPTV